MSEILHRTLLQRATFEVIPLGGVSEKTRLIDPGSMISVTASPTRGTAATVDLALDLQAQGHRAVPHLSARMIEDRQELARIIERLDQGGVTRVFVAGGDGDRHGAYFDAISLLRDMTDLGHPFREVGIAGYPEGHPIIPDALLRQALIDKQPYATYVVTQMCFAPGTIVGWVRDLRADGVVLPVELGVPGAVDATRLLAMSTRIGVGDSMRFLAKNRRAILRLLRPGRYSPDRLIVAMASLGEGLGLRGTHIFTFNQVAPTMAWHRRSLQRLS
jgi:methylenetetrahydrofolate reductase (NADPH)